MVTNAGTIALASPLQLNGGGATVVNQAGALFDVQGDVTLSSDGSGSQQIINAGTFRKSAGPNACTINHIAFQNAGTVGVLAGQLHLESPFTNSGGGLVLRLNSPTDWGQLVCSGPVVLGNSLHVSFGYVPTIGEQFQILSGPSLTGTFDPLNVQNGLASVVYGANSASLLITSTIPQILPPAMGDRNFGFSLNTALGQSYTIQYNDDLRTTNWRFYTNFTGNGSVMPVAAPVAGLPQRYFRVRQP